MKRLLILLTLLLLGCRPAYATARMVQGTIGTTSTGSTSCTVAATVSGNTLLVLFASDGTETVSSITDTNADTFTVVNNLYTQSTNQKGGYATAVATASNTTITLTWSGSSNNHYESCAEVNGTASCAAGACVDIAQGLGCTSAQACGPTPGQNAAQLDELVFSNLLTNTAVTANLQTTNDLGNCSAAASVCQGNIWGAGGIATTHVAAYYRAVFQGGTQTCTWTQWSTNSIAGVSCIGLKSANNNSATFLQGAVAAQSTGTLTCTLPALTRAGTVIVILFNASNQTDTVTGITDTNNDTFTIVNTIFTGGTSSSGGYATAISGSTVNQAFNITWAAGAAHNAACAEIVDTASCVAGACVDTGNPPGTAPKGHGCTSAGTACDTTSVSWTASQNDEIIFSFLMNNGNAVANSQTSADTGACTSSAPNTGSCPVSKWNSVGGASRTNSAVYYRKIAAGGAQTCSWTWTNSVIASTTCIGIKSGVSFTAMNCSMGLLGVGCEDEAAIEEQW